MLMGNNKSVAIKDKRSKKSIITKSILIAVCVLLVGICFYILTPNSINNTSLFHSNKSGPSAMASYFYYNNYIYMERYLVDELPEGAVLLGEIKNIGDKHTGQDFEGNDDGYIYTVPNDEGIMYVWAKYWEEAIAGEPRYIVFSRENIQHKP